MKVPFRVAAGGLEVDLAPAERSMLLRIPDLLISVEDAERAAQRLQPMAYQDPEEDAEFRRLVSADMSSGRTADRGGFAASVVGAQFISSEQAQAWLRVLSEARLVLGTRLDITEDGWQIPSDAGPEFALLGYLGFLQEELVDALSQLDFPSGQQQE